MTDNNKKDVLLIYTGGTIGSSPKDRNDPLSPLVPAPFSEALQYLTNYDPVDQSIWLEDKQIFLDIYEYENPVDSSNISHQDWARIALVIQQNYDDYEGFVVLHGTDVLAYTSSALAFMLDNLTKPVIITGSQRPIMKSRTDAIQNLVTSIEIAAARKLSNTVVPEVCVFFRNNLYRGCRSSKTDASGFNAFNSPNYPSLGTAGEKVFIHKEIIRNSGDHPLRVHTNFERNVAIIDIFPGISVNLLDTFFATEDLQGVILRTFGSGNVPLIPGLMDVFQNAVRNKIIMNVTQCCSGGVEPGLYEASSKLLSTGVIPGLDMTTESALTKLMFVLGMGVDKDISEDLLQIDLRGEQHKSIFYLHFGSGSIDKFERITLSPLKPMTLGVEKFHADFAKNIFLRLIDIGSKKDQSLIKVDLEFYMDLPDSNKDIDDSSPHFLGRISRNIDTDSFQNSLFMAANAQILDFVDNCHLNTVAVVNRSEAELSWARLDIAFNTKLP